MSSIEHRPSVRSELVDDEAHVERRLPSLDEMVTGGDLVTVERVRVLKYAAATKRSTAR